MKILVPLDGSEFAAEVLPIVKRLAAESQAEVTLAWVVNDEEAHVTYQPRSEGREFIPSNVAPLTGTPLGPPRHAEEHLAEDRVQAGRRLRAQAGHYLRETSLRHFDGKAAHVVLDGDDVAEALLAFAAAENVDLIAMTTHGRTGLGRMVLGSVANAVVHKGRVPALLARPSALPDGDQ